MNALEAAQLLTTMSALDGREVTEPAARAWATVLHDVAYADASEFVMEHFREVHALGYQRVMPADILAGVKAAHTRKVRQAAIDAYHEALGGLTMREATPELRRTALEAAYAAEAQAKQASQLAVGMLEIEAPVRPTW